MPYVKPSVPRKIPLVSDPAYYVMWKDRIKYGDIREVSKSSVRQVGPRGETEVDRQAMADATFLLHIVDWNLDDEEGNKLPLTADSLALLSEDDANQLATLLADANQVKDTERKN